MRKHVVAGIDVGAKELEVSASIDGKRIKTEKFANRAESHKKLCKWLTRGKRTVRVVLESTGTYSLDVALALHAWEGIEVMVANPRAVKDFARALFERSKSDTKDAEIIREFAARMPFVPFERPAEAVLELRGIARRIAALVVEKTREDNRLHALEATGTSSRVVMNDLEVNVRHLERRIELLIRHAMEAIEKDESLSHSFKLITSVKGIAERSGIQILGELLVLPADMSVRQWVAHSGLDPREYSSGESVYKRPRISKVGNVHLRRALYMPALVASQNEPRVKAFYEKLTTKGKEPLSALVAVMRKLLHAIFGMLKHRKEFNGEKFYAAA